MTNRGGRDLATTQLRRLALALSAGDEDEAAERLRERVARVDEPEYLRTALLEAGAVALVHEVRGQRGCRGSFPGTSLGGIPPPRVSSVASRD